MTVISTDNRYLTGRLSHQSIYKPKTFSWSHQKLAKLCNESASRGTALVPHDGLRPHQLHYLADEMAQCHSLQSAGGLRGSSGRRPHFPVTSSLWADERAECQSLARSTIVLPGDEHAASASGAGGRGVTTLRPSSSLLDAGNISDSALYEMGLLYDDEDNSSSGGTAPVTETVRSPRFGLNDIAHDCPLYTLHVRPAKRSSRPKRHVSDLASVALSDDTPPSPAMSFYDVADDEALATFGMDPDDYVDLGSAWDATV